MSAVHEPRSFDDARVPILLVDDYRSNLVSLEAILEAPDYELVSVTSGADALEAIARKDFAVVLLDVMMPDMDGFETALAIRRHARKEARRTPVIFVTGIDSSGPHLIQAYSGGAVDFIQKPLDPVMIRAKVAVFAELYRARTLSVAEQARREQEAAFRASEAQFRVLADTIPILAWYAEPDGYIPWFNQRWFEYTGTKLEQQEGFQWHSAIEPGERPRVVAKWQAALASGEPWEDEFRLRRHDGQYRWFLSRSTPLRESSGRIARWFGTSVDIDDQRRATDALQTAQREMERVNRAKDEFLSTMSHELRTPLHAITGWASILRRKPRDEGKLEHGLEVIERNAKAQARLVNDLLDVSRIVSGKLQLNLARTEVYPAVVAAVDVVRPAAEGRGVRLVVDVDPDIGTTLADADRLQQIVWNLLSNAIRFTPRGGRVNLTADRAGSQIVLRVQDSGAGIAPEHLPRIFDRFMQADSSSTRAHGGLGLGLSIVRHLVEAHGGSVEAHSEGVGRGSTFTVTLPLRTPQAAAGDPEEPPAADDAEVASPTAIQGVRVLVVDDEPDSLEVVRHVLERAGAQVTAAASAREAFEAIDAHGPFELVISDIGMPEMDGYAFMRRLRSVERTVAVPAIALTAYARSTDAELARRAGYQEHLAKPVDEAQLLRAVKTWSHTKSATVH